MGRAEIFDDGRGQAVRLPETYRFDGDEVWIQRLGRAVVLLPREAAWETFLDGLDSFTEDVFQDGREPEVPTKREPL